METIDWNEELNEAIENEPTVDYYDFLCDKSSSWITCAVGNQCSIIPICEFGGPIDENLRKLGFLFHTAIEHKKWYGAQEILEDIELRSAILINELTN